MSERHLASRSRSALAVAVLIVACGCESIPAPTPDDEAATKQTLERALASWQKGEPIGGMEKASPPIKVSDPKWERGDKLTEFELQGPGRSKGAQRAYRVALSLTDAKGKPTKEIVEYRVGTQPYETVSRLIFD
jgi:Tfp pilus assembly protein PilF